MTTAPSTYRRRDRSAEEYGAWFTVAIVVHIVAAIILWFFTPLRDYLNAATQVDKPEQVVSTAKIEEIDQFVEEANERQLRAQVSELENLLDEMREQELQQQQAFTPIHERQAEQAPQQLDDALAQAEAAMGVAAEAIEEGDLNEAARQQAIAEEQQERAVGQLGLLGDPAQQVIEAQQAAADAQRGATDVRHEAGQIEDQIEGVRDTIERLETELAEWTGRRDEARATESERAEQVEQLQSEMDRHSAEAEEQERIRQSAETEKRAARQIEDKNERNAAEESAENTAREAQQRRDEARKARDEVRNRHRNAERQLTGARRDAERAQANVERRESSLETQREREAELTQSAEQRRAEALAAQQAALAQQQEVAEQMRQAARELLAARESGEGESDEGPEFDRPDLDALAAAALMDRAAEVEQEVAEAYKRTRAMRLAPVLGMTYKQAYDNIDVTVPERETFDPELLEGDADTVEEIDAKKAEFARAQQQASAMNELANLLLFKAQQEVRRGMSSGDVGAESVTSGDFIGGASQQGQSLAELASVDASGQSADLTGAMAGLLGIAGSGGAGEEEPEATEEAEVEGNYQPERGDMPPMIDENVQPLASRRVAGDAEAAEAPTGNWLAVTDWWVIGPYDNPGRKNIDRKFDPENVVDLSAVYPNAGKSGRDLRWVFHTSGHRDQRGLTDENGEPIPTDRPNWIATRPMNFEPYGIWYAYTEIEMPDDRPYHEVWFAFGSDDKGKVWLLDDTAGDVLIWESASHHKGWTPGEALRKVILRPGINRILFRIENGHGPMEWSMMISAGKAEG